MAAFTILGLIGSFGHTRAKEVEGFNLPNMEEFLLSKNQNIQHFSLLNKNQGNTAVSMVNAKKRLLRMVNNGEVVNNVQFVNVSLL